MTKRQRHDLSHVPAPELARELRRRQTSKTTKAQRSAQAKRAALVRWAKKKGKELLGL